MTDTHARSVGGPPAADPLPPPAAPALAPGAAFGAVVGAEAAADIAMLDAIVDAMPAALYAYDRDWRCVRINGVARRALRDAGVEPDEFLGGVLWEIVPDLVGGPFHANLTRCARERVAVRFEASNRRGGGWTETTAFPTAFGVVAYTHDIEDRRRAARRERLLVEAGALLSGRSGERETLAAIAAAAVHDFADACLLTLQEASDVDVDDGPRRPVVVEAASRAPEVARELRALASAAHGGPSFDAEVARTGRAELHAVLDVERAPIARALAPLHAGLSAAPPASAIVAPLVARSRVVGTITFLRLAAPSLEPFDDDDLACAEELGRRTAVAVDSERLFAAEHEARSRAERLQALTASLARARTVDEVATVVVADMVGALGARTGALAACAPDGDELVLLRTEGFPEPVAAGVRRQPLDLRSPLTECFRTQSPVWIETRHGPEGLDARFPPISPVWDALGVRAAAFVPLIAAGETVGVISFSFERPRLFRAEERAFLLALGQQAALAMERARLFEAEHVARAEAERERADLAAVLQVVPVGIGIARDPECRDIRVNPVLAAQLGVAPEGNASKSGPDAHALPFRVLQDGEEVPPERLPMQRAAREGAALNDESLEIVHPDGRRVRLLEFAAPLHDEAGNVRGAVGAFVDITERERLLEAERAARARVEGLQHVAVRAAEHAARVAAAASSFNAASTVKEATAVLLRESHAAVGADASLVTLLHDDVRELEIVDSIGYPDYVRGEWRRFPVDAPVPLGEAVRLGTAVHFETEAERARRYPGTPPTGYEGGLVVPLRSGGRMIGALALSFRAPRLLDDDDRRLLDTLALQWAQVLDRAQLFEAERATRADAEQARHAAEAANRSKAEFLTVMSHELRTPLNAIGGYAELLELGIRGPVTAAQRADLERIQTAQRTLLRRINDVLNFAKLEAGHVEFDLRDVAVTELLAAVEPLVAPQVAARRLAYACAPCDASLRVRVDPEKLGQVLLNLVSNAVKFTPAEGSVLLVAEALDDERVVIRVRDTGVGIPAEKLPSVFEPFVQVDTRHTRQHDGTGLGLAISRDLVRGMGGELTAVSAVGVGSTFVITLPRAG